MRVRLALLLALCGPIAAVSPALAQGQIGSDGERFLKAVREQDAETVIELVDTRGPTVINYRGYGEEAALHLVTRARQANWIHYLVGKGGDPNIRGKEGETALMIAARIGFDEGARRLLASGARVDEANRLGETALIIAVRQRQPLVVRMLLEAGANPDKADHAAGYSARDYARRDTRSPELLKLIDTVKAKGKAVGPTRN